MTFLRRLAQSRFFVPLALLLLTLLTYGLFVPQLGFYWDDWWNILIGKQFPISGYWTVYSHTNRPLTAWTFSLFRPLVGTTPLAWQTLGLALRAANVLAAGWLFRLIWPHKRLAAGVAAALFAVYPIFLQQPIAVTYHQHWTSYLLFTLSFALMALAVRRPQSALWLTGLGVLASAGSIAVHEYYVGVDLLRPLVLWFVQTPLEPQRARRLRRTLLAWLPYLLLLGAFVIFRLTMPDRSGYNANRPELLLSLLSQPLAAIGQLGELALRDSLFALFASWQEILRIDPLTLGAGWIPRLVAVALLAGGLTFALAAWLRREETEPPAGTPDWLPQALILGLAGTVLGGLPIWTTGRSALDGMLGGRFLLASMLWAGLFWAAALEWVTGRRRALLLIVAVMVTAAASLHLHTANLYRQSWRHQQNVAWQLFWRAPSIEPGTAIFTDDHIYPYVRRTFQFNLLYGQPDTTEQVSYWHFDIDHNLPPEQRDTADDPHAAYSFLGFTFTGDPADRLTLYYDPAASTNCLALLTPEDADDPFFDPLTRQSAAQSDLSRVGAQPARADIPYRDIFGPEPEHGWCYFVQKAELAQQNRDWAGLSGLYDQVSAAGLLPAPGQNLRVREWRALLRGLAETGRTDEAARLSRDLASLNPANQPDLCRVWAVTAADPSYSGAARATAADLQAEIGCP
jgi:hypothetical protein